MQYRLPKKRFLPILLISAFLAAILSFYILSRQREILSLLFPYVTAIFTVALLYVIGRYLAFGMLYQLGEDYTDLTLTIRRLHQTSSLPIASIEFYGSEELICWDKQGKKRLKKEKRLGVYTANLVPDGCYALVCKIDGRSGYILLELNGYAKQAVEDRITRAKNIYSVDPR